MDKCNHLVWLDLEMTGLNPNHDEILEMALVITDENLNVVAEMDSIAIHHEAKIFANLDAWNQKHHSESGLIAHCLASKINTVEAEKQALLFLQNQGLKEKSSPLCGNSICQDRRFLARLMPNLERFFHYRNLDVSTIKELAKRWYPQKIFEKQNLHTALSDIHESIAELRFYQQEIFKPQE